MSTDTMLKSSQYLRNPSYLKLYSWEAEFEFEKWRSWIGQYWTASVYASIIYVALIFSIQRWMRDRRPYKLRRALFIWNLGLAAFSSYGFARVFPEVMYLIRQPNPVHTAVCTMDGHNFATVFWGFFCTLSKMVELGDTIFIVLRKQPLIFLHWFHHITVMLYTWSTYEQYDPSLKLFMCMNFFVHGLMYTYYALKSLGVKIPRSFAMVITALQMSQMVVGVFINSYSLYAKKTGIPCNREDRDIYIALSMYASYFILFFNFFLQAYFIGAKKRKAFDNSSKNNNNNEVKGSSSQQWSPNYAKAKIN